MEKIFFCFFSILLFLGFASCNSSKKISTTASIESNQEEQLLADSDRLVKLGNYENALAKLDHILNSEPNNAQALSRKGAIYFGQGKKQDAFEWLNKAVISNDSIDKDILYSAFIAANEVHEYQTVIKFGEKLQSMNGLTLDRKTKVNNLLDKNNTIKEILAKPLDIMLHPLPAEINSLNLEYLPRISLDDSKIYFIRRENQNEVIYVSERNQDLSWGNPYVFNIWKDLSSAGAFSIGEGHTRSVVTLCNSLSGNGSCDLYLSRWNGTSWTAPKNLGDVINSKNWDSQPCISPDGNKIYFSSDRPGGYGGRDIWLINIDGNVWKEPINMGPMINSSGNDESPFIHADGHTLYFRSDGWPGLGSYDNFISRLNLNGVAVSEPVNLGYPINTFGDDGAFALSSDGKTAYFASDYFSIEKEVKPNLDLITFELPEIYRSVPTTYLLVEVKDVKTGNALNASYELIDLIQNLSIARGSMLVGSSNPIPIVSGTNLGLFVQSEGYYPHSENFQPEAGRNAANPYKISIALQPLEEAKPIVLKNIFFDTNSAVLKQSSYTELEKLIDLLKSKPNMKIKILGHTDDVGNDKENQILSENRAKSVYQFLIDREINAQRLSFEGKGESMPLVNNTSEEGRAQNRRTEFIELK